MPGFMLGSAAEKGAQMRRGARALLASAEAEVPKIEFMLRKSYGVAADAPNSIGHPHNVNLRFGWPAGEWGGIPIEGGVAAAYKREIENAPDPEAHRKMIEDRLLAYRSPIKAAHDLDVIGPHRSPATPVAWPANSSSSPSPNWPNSPCAPTNAWSAPSAEVPSQWKLRLASSGVPPRTHGAAVTRKARRGEFATSLESG